MLRLALVVWISAVCDLRSPLTQNAVSPSCARCGDVVDRVRKLLPHAPDRLVIMDTARESRLFQQQVLHADGFVKAGDDTVYLKLSGPTLQHALAGRGIWDYALAIIVWHEMAHLEGADEQTAQLREEALWEQFVAKGVVDANRGRKYLRLLRDRRLARP